MRRLLHPLSAVLFLFVLSRALAHGQGLVFDDETFLRFWHAIDVSLLRSRLWESLLHLHSQPPLLNALVGAVHQLAPSHSGAMLHAGFVLLGAAHTVAVYGLGRSLGWGPRVAAIAAGLVVLSPSALLYEHFLFYTHPTAVLLSVSGLGLVAALRRPGWAGWLLFFGLLAVAVWLRSLFHGIWLVSAVGFGLALSAHRRAVLRGAAIPLLVVGLLYAKNGVMFGTPTTSSWLGMSLARMSTDRMAEAPREALIASGVLHPIARVRSFEHLSAYASFVDITAKTGVPLLDASDKSNGALNLHHHAYLEVSALYSANFQAVMRAQPELYWRRVRRARARFWTAPWRYPPLEPNLPVVSGLLGAASSEPRTWSLWIITAAGLLGAALSPRADRARALRLWLAGLIVYVWLVGTLLEVGENYRFRFLITAPTVLLGIDAVRRLWGRLFPFSQQTTVGLEAARLQKRTAHAALQNQQRPGHP